MIADTFMSMEVILFKLLALISLIVFSNVGSSLNFSASKLLLIHSILKELSNYMIAYGLVSVESTLFR